MYVHVSNVTTGSPTRIVISNQPKYGFVCHSDIYTSKLSVYIRVGLGEMQMKRKPPKTQLT